MSNELKAEMISGLRRFAKSVMVISCAYKGERFAMSATAVSEVSLDPPSMLICINRETKIYKALSQGTSFCINMLQSGQEDIARNCGGERQGEDRFLSGNWENNKDNIPFLGDAQANFFCRNEGGTSFGTHDIFIGIVTLVKTLDAVDPLIYVDGLYMPISLSSEV